MSKAVNVFTQKTPNPNAYKFPTSIELVPEGSYEFRKEDAPTGCAFVDHFFNSWDVERVYIASNFVTVLKAEGTEWFEFSRDVRDFISEAIRDELYSPERLPATFRLQTANDHPQLNEWFAGTILPATEKDGGGIFLKSYNDGELRIGLAGACYNCPYAPQTIQKGIAEPLHRQLGELKKIKVEDLQTAS